MPVDTLDGMSLTGRRSPRVEVFADEHALAESLARRIADLVAASPRLVLGLPTGRTPLALYRELSALHAHRVGLDPQDDFHPEERDGNEDGQDEARPGVPHVPERGGLRPRRVTSLRPCRRHVSVVPRSPPRRAKLAKGSLS